MAKTIHQSIEFPGVTPEALFDIYVDPAKHGKAVAAPVTVSDSEGAPFSAFGEGRVRGRNLLVVPKRAIVQSWRGGPWAESDLDSILVLTFSESSRGARIDLVQALVPDLAFEVIDGGWHRMYWEPWRAYLQSLGS